MMTVSDNSITSGETNVKLSVFSTRANCESACTSSTDNFAFSFAELSQHSQFPAHSTTPSGTFHGKAFEEQ